MQVDESPIRYLEPGYGRARQGYVWSSSRPSGEVFYHWNPSRSAACLQQVVPAEFQGTLQCDGYSAYPAFANQRPSIRLAGCWAHVRRKFYAALDFCPRTTSWVMRQIQNLYRVESASREGQAGPRSHQAVRGNQSSPPLVERLHRALIALKASRRYLPQSVLSQAIDYASGQWKALEIQLEDCPIEIDNNLAENAIRPTALGKKNWLFIGQAAVGERGTILYTVIESCRRRGLDPYGYFRAVLSRLPTMTNHRVPEITPEAWSKKPPVVL